MRIMFVADTLGSGGKERQLVELLKGLDRRDDVSWCLCLLSSNVHYSDARSLKGEVRTIVRKFRYDPTVFPKLYSAFREFRPDLVQSWELMCSVYAQPVAKLLGLKFVSMIRNAPEKIPIMSSTWLRSRLTFPFSDMVIANSRAGLEAYRISGESRCIHNGFDFNRLVNLESKEDMCRRFGIRGGRIVGMVGKFHPKKDNATFIQAAINVCKDREDVTFVAVGDGVNLERCRQMVDSGLHSRILFVGKQEHVESIVNIFDIGVLATFTEGISNSIMEYMALAKPVIATDGGGTSELVENNQTGFLVPVRDPQAMADRIIHLLDHPEEASAMGKEGRRKMETSFNLARMAHDFVQAYRDCIVDRRISVRPQALRQADNA
jgi:glycosyltransferase involved in cell wall biosynthesis